MYPGSTVFMAARLDCHAIAALFSVIMLSAAFDRFVCTCLTAFSAELVRSSNMALREETLFIYALGLDFPV